MAERDRNEVETCVLDEGTQTVDQVSTEPSSGDPGLPRGAALGRYLVLDPLGSGGMSVVYSAYDPELDRKVAVKLMRTSYWNEIGRNRALREAQALAKLSHPNIIAVLDVGTLNDQLFIAMELVDGHTLGDWIEAEQPGWSSIVAAMIQAGRGLAAAHQAGLVHRDIKPSNIMVDRSGRTRIMDFGVAVADQRTGPMAPVRLVPTPVGLESPLFGTLTRDGAIVGTPSYMPPEQHGGTADARSDQYSFCVTLYEALCGERPSKDVTEQRTWSLRRSEAATGPGITLLTDRALRVPSWLRAAIARGLNADPAARYPSMEHLLAALTHGPRQQVSRSLILAGAISLAAVVGVGIWSRQPSAAPLCGGAAELMTGTWDGDVKRAIQRATGRSGRPYAEETWGRVADALDARAAQWIQMRTEACQATRIRGEQSETLLDLRMSCLDRQLGDLRALTSLFAAASRGDVVDHAIKAVLELPPVARCADADALLGAPPLPRGQAVRDQIEAVYRRLADASALTRAGEPREALAALTSAVAEAKQSSFEPVYVEALLRLAELQNMLGDAHAAEALLSEALERAARLRDDRSLADAARQLLYTLGYVQARYAEALAMSRLAEAFVARAGDDRELRSAIYTAEGVTLWAASRYEEARRRFEQVVELERGPGGRELSLASAYNSLGLVLKDLNQYADARASLDQARAIWERLLGPNHPDVARVLNNLGELLIAQRDYGTARADYRRALEIFEGAFGADSRFVEIVLNNLGELDVLDGDFGAALASCRRATEIAKETVDARHPLVAYHAACEAKALLGLRRPAEALPAATLAASIADAGSVDPADAAEIRFTLARALWDAGRDRPRAVRLAIEARGLLAAAGLRKQVALAEVQAWLAPRAPVRSR